MDKDIVKEIFLLFLEVIKAFCEMIWKGIKNFFSLIWDRFFGMADVSSIDKAEEQEWGVTGEDTWPTAPKAASVMPEALKPQIKRKETLPVPGIPVLPDDYGDNRIVLMVRDTEWLFTYWEIQKEIMSNVLNTFGSLAHSAKIVLRVYDVTDIIFDGNNAHKYFTIEISGRTRSWYIHAGEPNRLFCVDIGFLTPNGTFRILSRSNTARTPRAGVSEVIDETWMSIAELYEKVNVYVPMGFGISESMFERAHKGLTEILKEGVSSSDYPVSSSISKK
ncbi:MAG: DUF4912 domain-containing protein [Planctomycetia bacterium]|nr:DUF4912 domain-containing protein [Planctomycetia bacterium]